MANFFLLVQSITSSYIAPVINTPPSPPALTLFRQEGIRFLPIKHIKSPVGIIMLLHKGLSKVYAIRPLDEPSHPVHRIRRAQWPAPVV
jgi:hypothetical protein